MSYSEESTEPSTWGPMFKASSTIYYVAFSKLLNFAETQFPFLDVGYNNIQLMDHCENCIIINITCMYYTAQGKPWGTW